MPAGVGAGRAEAESGRGAPLREACRLELSGEAASGRGAGNKQHRASGPLCLGGVGAQMLMGLVRL